MQIKLKTKVNRKHRLPPMSTCFRIDDPTFSICDASVNGMEIFR